ncbi:MAG: hypothetical protein RQ728_06810 [Brevefilum sp.]|nr:hypothetical protein [Brevefilum sp.]MDT8381952.1 hypothetical protein [Brevefilum sp.]MDW7754710.1 hypothetical protein [Brevefilum sp.]
MEPLLIAIVLLLVIIIGYILSRPFDNPPETPTPPSRKADHKSAYDALLDEIKSLQEELKAGGDIDGIEEQIRVKKQEAANLLRQEKASLDDGSKS